jgi:hypothetical protein
VINLNQSIKYDEIFCPDESLLNRGKIYETKLTIFREKCFFSAQLNENFFHGIKIYF